MVFRVPDAVVALIRSLHPQLKRKVRAALQAIQENPTTTGKLLQDELAGLQSVRVRRWRVIYRVAADSYIDIVAIGSRHPIYEETYRLINQGLQDR